MSKRAAIIGIGAINSLGISAPDVWAAIMAGTRGIRPMERFARGRFMTDCAGEIQPAMEHALRGREACTSGGRARLFATAAGREALACAPGDCAPADTGLVLSTVKAELDAFEAMAAGDHSDGTQNPFVLAQAVAGDLRLGGPVFAVSNACASGLVAIAQAARMLQRGQAEAMLVIGVDALAEFVLAGFSSLAALSARPCRPYDAARDGLSLGEGAGAALMTSRPSGGDGVFAHVTGWGVTNDANHITAPSRTGEGLKAAAMLALSTARLSPADIGCINGHGTGTVYNDLSEAKALYEAFGDAMPPVASVKGYFGHTLGAAGVIEVVISIAAMREQTVPGCMGLESPGVDVPLNISREHRRVSGMRNVLAVKCGFGGVNAAVVLSQEAAR